MKILHITADWKWTGPAEPMLHAVRGLRERGHQVDFICPPPAAAVSGALLERAHERGLEPVYQLERRRGFMPLRDRGEVRRLRELLRRGSYEVVHAHHTRDHLLCAWATRGIPARLVVSWHCGDPIPRKPWTRLLLGPRGTHGLVLLSQRLAERAQHDLGWPAERLAVVPGAVDTARFRPRAASETLRRELGIENEERVIGVVARLQKHRRFDLLLEAFSRAVTRYPGLRLLVVGRGTRAREVLEEPVARLGLDKAVIRAGYRRADYLDVLSLMDALAFLVPGSDGSCRAVMEAMSMEIPVIASRRGILPEMISDLETGRVLAENVELLAQAFEDVARNPSRWRTLGEAARQRIVSEHTLEQQAERLESFYAALGGGVS